MIRLHKEYYIPRVVVGKLGFSFDRNKWTSDLCTYVLQGAEFVMYRFFGARIDHENSWYEPVKAPRVDKANKYLRKQYGRMAKALDQENWEKYSRIFERLRDSSESFLIAMITRKLKFYGIALTLGKLMKLKGKIRRILVSKTYQLKFKRHFLKEYYPDGKLKKLRPLGVPSREWRVVAGMYEFYLANLLKGDWNPNQYACMKRHGAVDAWINVLQNIEKYPNIVGYDLAKFFDTVYIKAADFSLYKVPNRIRCWISHMNNCKPDISNTNLVHERKRIENLSKERPIILYPEVEDFMTSSASFWNPTHVALPQGLNTSPLIACNVLGETGALDPKELARIARSKKKTHIIQYVDDGILMTKDGPWKMLNAFKEALKTPYTGISLSESKTELIKNNGVWIKPLRFLGCEYDGKVFSAFTRKHGKYVNIKVSKGVNDLIRYLRTNRDTIEMWYARKDLARHMATIWDHSQDGFMPDLNLNRVFHEEYQTLEERVKRNSLLDLIIRERVVDESSELYSVNTQSTLLAELFLKCAASTKKENLEMLKRYGCIREKVRGKQPHEKKG